MEINKKECIPENIFFNEQSFNNEQTSFDNEQTSFNNKPSKKLSYDDILKNMGMYEVKGTLFWEKNNIMPHNNNNNQTISTSKQINVHKNIVHNSSSNNSYKKEDNPEQNNTNLPPINLLEYRNLLIRRMIEKNKINKIKSRNMIFK